MAGGSALVYRVPSARGAGIWSAAGPALSASGDVYVVTGNGAARSLFDSSNAVIQLSPDLQGVRSYFAPSDWAALNASDTDLGALGPSLVGDMVVAVGKDGVAYLLREGQLGGVRGQVSNPVVCGGAYGRTADFASHVYAARTAGPVAASVAAP